MDNAIQIATGLSLLGFASIVGTILNKRLPQRVSALDLLEQVQADNIDNRARIVKLEGVQRQTVDYVHELRRHITDEKPPPPPPWPQGLAV